MTNVNASLMAKTLRSLRKAVGPKYPLPVLGCVRIKAQGGKAILQVTNLETFAQVAIPAAGELDVSVPHKEIAAIVGQYKGDVEIAQAQNDLIVAGTRLKGFDSHEFPPFPNPTPIKTIHLDAAPLYNAAKLAKDAGDTPIAVCANGGKVTVRVIISKASLREFSGEGKGEDGEILIDPQRLAEIAPALPKSGEVSITVGAEDGKDMIVLAADNLWAAFYALPSYRLSPPQVDLPAEIGKVCHADLHRAIKRAKAISGNFPIMIQIGGNKVWVKGYSEDTEVGTVCNLLTADTPTPPALAEVWIRPDLYFDTFPVPSSDPTPLGIGVINGAPALRLGESVIMGTDQPKIAPLADDPPATPAECRQRLAKGLQEIIRTEAAGMASDDVSRALIVKGAKWALETVNANPAPAPADPTPPANPAPAPADPTPPANPADPSTAILRDLTGYPPAKAGDTPKIHRNQGHTLIDMYVEGHLAIVCANCNVAWAAKFDDNPRLSQAEAVAVLSTDWREGPIPHLMTWRQAMAWPHWGLPARDLPPARLLAPAVPQAQLDNGTIVAPCAAFNALYKRASVPYITTADDPPPPDHCVRMYGVPLPPHITPRQFLRADGKTIVYVTHKERAWLVGYLNTEELLPNRDLPATLIREMAQAATRHVIPLVWDHNPHNAVECVGELYAHYSADPTPPADPTPTPPTPPADPAPTPPTPPADPTPTPPTPTPHKRGRPKIEPAPRPVAFVVHYRMGGKVLDVYPCMTEDTATQITAQLIAKLGKREWIRVQGRMPYRTDKRKVNIIRPTS